MVLCIVALAVFAVLGIFSAKYRQLAKDAFSCVKEMLLFKPCTTKLDERIKAKITGKLMGVPSVARFFYRNFTVLSWVFTLAFFSSTAYSAYAIYNLIRYGTCTPSNPASCVITKGYSSISAALASIFYQVSCNEAKIAYVVLAILVVALIVIVYLGRKPKARKR